MTHETKTLRIKSGAYVYHVWSIGILRISYYRLNAKWSLRIELSQGWENE